MRVVIDGRVVTDHFPGIGRYAFHLVDALATVAPDLELAVLHTVGQTDARFDLTALAHPPNVRLVPVASGLFAPAGQWQVRRAVRSARADVFHATYPLSGFAPGAPSVLSLYDLIGRRVPGSVPGARLLALDLAVRLALRSARRILTLSEWSKRDLVSAGVPPARITVTPLAADTRFRPTPPADVVALRARLGLPRRYVLYVGINKPHKNLETLVAAWGRMAPAPPDVGRTDEEDAGPPALVIAGRWDPRYPAARRLAETLPATARVLFLGPQAEADLPALYSGAVAFAFPSRYEGFGLPPLEAMACGAPVVAANATSLPEVVGEAGLLVDPDDVGAWAAALRRVIGDPELADDMRRRGLARAATFSWDDTALRTLAAYGEAAGPTPPR